MVSSKKAANRSPETQEKDVATAAQKAANNWLKFAPTYQIPHIKLSQLMQRPKNSLPDIAAADATILKMQDIRPDACSARFVDSECRDTLVCVFSHRLPPAGEIAPEKRAHSEAQAEVFFSFPLQKSCRLSKSTVSCLPRLRDAYPRGCSKVPLQVLGWHSCQ